MKALAVDLGGSHAACAVVDGRDVVAVETVSLEAARGLAGVALSDCEGLAFGFCGLVDSAASRVLSTNAKYDDAPSVDLAGWCGETLEGRACTCGAVGSVEAEASTWALPALCRETPGFPASALAVREPLDFEAVFACADEGDAVAAGVRDRCLRVWAAGAVAMVHAWDPEVLVIGGGVMRRAGAVLPAVAAHVHRHAWTPWGKVAVRPAALGERAALLGAVPLLEGA